MFQRQVVRDAKYLFSTSIDTIDVMKKQPEQGGHPNDLEKTRCSNPKAMQLEAEGNSSREQHSIYIVSQNTSWSCLNVSLESFRNIVNIHNFSDDVYDVVQAFRRRTSNLQQFRWSACRARLSSPEGGRYEICYRIQYPVRNNHDRGDPFSMRQIGICQKNNGPRNSAWILLQPSPEVVSRLELAMNGQDFISVHEADPMSLHLIFLDFQSINWDDFVEHLRISLQPLVDAAHFSRVGRSCKYPLSDYSVEFEQCQNLQKFQWKLNQITPAIDGNIAVLKTCEERWLEYRTRPRIQSSIAEVRGLVKQLEFHKESIQKFADQAQRSTELLHRILDYRSSKEMEKTNANMYHTLGKLDSQAKILILLSEQRDKDSKAMKALTSVATLYLPASLVATIFSSNLVQLLPKTPPQKPSHFVAAPQTWLPIIATLSLMAVTLLCTRLLERAYRYFK